MAHESIGQARVSHCHATRSPFGVAAARRAAEQTPGFEGWSIVNLDASPHGVGIFAAREIAAGDHIVSLHGGTIDFSAAVARGGEECYPMQISLDRTYIDLVGVGRYVNHSCAPNAGVVTAPGVKRYSLAAIRAIRKGEEVRYDYSTTMLERRWSMRCTCGAATCRSVIGDFDSLPVEARMRYFRAGIVPPFLRGFVPGAV